MTVRVVYTRFGEQRTIDFDSEQEAGIFMDGLGTRDDHRFKRVEYPDLDPEDVPPPTRIHD